MGSDRSVAIEFLPIHMGSNCLSLGDSWQPRGVVSDHGVERNDELAHDGDDGDLWLLADGNEPLLEGFEGGIEPGGDLSGHEEAAPDGGPAAEDAAQAYHPSTVEVVGDDADQGGDRSDGQGAELGQQGDQGGGQDRSAAGHGAQQIASCAEGRAGSDGSAYQLVELLDVVFELSDPARHQAAQAGVAQLLELADDLLMGIDQLPPCLNQLGLLFVGSF